MPSLTTLFARNNVNNTLANEDASHHSGSGSFDEAHHDLFRIGPEVTPVHLAYTLLSVFTIAFGVFSAFIKEKIYAGEAIIALCVGIGMGPYGANIFSPTEWGGGDKFDEITLEITRIVIALSVFAVGVELPRAYMWKHWRSLAILLGPTMLFGWMVAAGFMYLLIPGLSFLDCLVAAACVTPTDPILAASVVGKGKFAQEHVPAHIRHILQAESGSNDGAAFPFLYFALFWLLRDHDAVGTAVGWWIVLVIFYQIILGVFIGAFVGVMARKIMKFSKYHALMDRESMVAMYVALALFVTGVTTLAGSDDLLAAFACGTAFAWDDWFSESIEDSNFSSILDLIVNCGIFFYVGASIPFAAWDDRSLTLEPWRLAVLALCVLIFRRLPVILALHKFIPDIRTIREAVFVGHFGPIGIGALFISTLAKERLPTPRYPAESSRDILALTIVPITYCLILCSVMVHGMSIPVFTNGRRIHRRVSSFGRTFTTTSARGGESEPSWLSRVRRVGDSKPVDESKEDEKAGEDEETLQPSSSTSSDNLEKEKQHDATTVQHEKESTERPEDENVWREGSDIVIEDASGEHVRVEHGNKGESSTSHHGLDAGFAGKAHEIQAMITEAERRRKEKRKGKGRVQDSDDNDASSSTDESPSSSDDEGSYASKRSQRSANLKKSSRTSLPAAIEPDPAPLSSKPRQRRGYLWKWDEKTGIPRPLSESEKRKARKDRAIRKERHYCTQGSEVRWREGHRIVVENADGELVRVIDEDEERQGNRSGDEGNDFIGDFPDLHRLSTSEHEHMSSLLHKVLHHQGNDKKEHHSAVMSAFDAIAGPSAAASAPTPPPPAARPKAIRLTTGGFRQRFFGHKATATSSPQPASAPPEAGNPAELPSSSSADSGPPPSRSAAPGPLQEFSKELTRNPTKSSIRFNLPSDQETKRYDLDGN